MSYPSSGQYIWPVWRVACAVGVEESSIHGGQQIYSMADDNSRSVHLGWRAVGVQVGKEGLLSSSSFENCNGITDTHGPRRAALLFGGEPKTRMLQRYDDDAPLFPHSLCPIENLTAAINVCQKLARIFWPSVKIFM